MHDRKFMDFIWFYFILRNPRYRIPQIPEEISHLFSSSGSADVFSTEGSYS